MTIQYNNNNMMVLNSQMHNISKPHLLARWQYNTTTITWWCSIVKCITYSTVIHHSYKITSMWHLKESDCNCKILNTSLLKCNKRAIECAVSYMLMREASYRKRPLGSCYVQWSNHQQRRPQKSSNLTKTKLICPSQSTQWLPRG